MTKERFVKICPRCGSTNITIPPSGMDIKMTMPDYCSDCDSRGIFPEIKKSEIENFRKKLKN